MYSTILVPVDGSETSQTALGHAIRLATDMEATVHILTVVEPPGNLLGFGVDEVDDINRAIGNLVDATGGSQDQRDVSIQTEVKRGEPVYEMILTYADEIDADVIILGRRGTSTVPDIVLGSTADRVSRFSEIPVLLVPDTQAE